MLHINGSVFYIGDRLRAGDLRHDFVGAWGSKDTSQPPTVTRRTYKTTDVRWYFHLWHLHKFCESFLKFKGHFLNFY